MAELCHRCLYDTDHPFGLTLRDGLCSGCRTHEEKDALDWAGRRRELEQLVAAGRRRSRSRRSYDCVIGVHGDAEDFYVVQVAVELGLHPLLVAVNDYFGNDIGWHNLHTLITCFDLDSIIYNPEMRTYRELVRVALRKWSHMLWPALALRSAYPVHVALERRIPLVIWGQHQAVEQVGKFSHLDAVEMTGWSRVQHDLFGRDVDDTVGNGAEIGEGNLHYYRYPDIRALSRARITGVYLSNYLRWDPFAQNADMVAHGFRPQEQSATFDPYERAGSSVYYGIHDLMKLQRVGYRKVRDHLVREIRHGRIDREAARTLEAAYSAAPVELDGFFDWLGMTDSGRQWFLRKRMGDVSDLVTGAAPAAAPPLPDAVAALRHPGKKPSRCYLTYAKGI